MNALSTAAAAPAAPAATDYAAIKTRQKAAWGSGDYTVIGTTLQIVGESLCEAVDLRAGQQVLDVAAGNGNATLAAARRWCHVTSTDYVPALLERGRERALGERLQNIDFLEADVEALPFADHPFDAVLSTFGCMFAPDSVATAGEMLRVCKPGGKIGMANWTPDSFIGQLFKTIGQHVAPPAGVASPALWGDPDRLAALFGAGAGGIQTAVRHFVMRYRSPAHWLEVFRTFYGPVHKAFAALDGDRQPALAADILALIGRFNRSGDGTVVLPSAYLEAVVTKS